MTTLQSRLQDELIGSDTPDKDGTCTYDSLILESSSRDNLRAEQTKKLGPTAATIASDLKGMLPVAQLLALTKELMELQYRYDTNNLGRKTDDGSAEQDLAVRQQKIEQRLLDAFEAVVGRYCGLTKETQ